MEQEVHCLQKGHIYYFYRPKVQHKEARSMKDVQRFFMVLKPTNEAHYILIIIGRKQMPESTSHFAFVDKVTNRREQLIQSLGEFDYNTQTRGPKTESFVRCVGKGKYLLVNHKGHTHFLYQLEKPFEIGEVQKDFNLKEADDYLLNIKNPEAPTPPKAGLTSGQKAILPRDLQEKFMGKNFISLNHPKFLQYEGVELLLIGKEKRNLLDKENGVERCLNAIPEDNFLQDFAKMEPPESLEPLEEKKWKQWLM